MTPTLAGRVQTRIAALGTVGVLWTLVVTPLLPGVSGAPYAMTLRLLVIVAAAGIAWEVLYHGLQQLRWEKDWPTLFGLATGVNEGALVWLLAARFGPDVPGVAFAVHFTTTWVLVWAFVQGPVQVLLPHWRFRGGRVL